MNLPVLREVGYVTRDQTVELRRNGLTGVDELMDSYELSDATWSALGARFDERQRMDFVFTIGCYITVAMALKTFGIELDQER